jgi:hypothetical protein
MAMQAKEYTFEKKNGNGMQQAADVVERAYAGAYTGTVRQAAEEAATMYDVHEINKHAEMIIGAWKARLESEVRMVKQTQISEQAAGPITAHPALYQWWNVLLAGPFQPVAPLGPFLPHKIIEHGQPAFMIAAIVRNPQPLPGGPNPSAAQIMAGFDYRVTLSTGKLNTWTAGPSFGPQGGVFGGGFVNFQVFNLTGFNVPADTQPDLYEANLVMDIVSAAPGLPPFAGYATWVLDPDVELPTLFTPGQGPRLQHDIPARFLMYQ